MWGSGPSRANKFLYAPAPPPPSVWAVVQPMIYTALCIMFWMRAYPLLGQVGGDCINHRCIKQHASVLHTKQYKYNIYTIVLIFLIPISGSMGSRCRLPLEYQSMNVLSSALLQIMCSRVHLFTVLYKKDKGQKRN